MTLFVLIALLITLLVLWIAVRPLLKNHESRSDVDGDGANVRFLQSRLDELEQQHSTGKLSDTEFTALKAELESNLAIEIESSEVIKQHRSQATTTASRGFTQRVAIVLLVTVPLSCALLYWWVGHPEVVTLMQESASEEPAFDIAEVSAMVAQIEARLDAQPDDLEGWRVLSRTYLGLGRYAEAERAYLQVLRLGGENAAVYAALADAAALNAQGQLSGKPIEYVTQALALDPQHPQALWLAGLHAAQTGDNLTAKRYWSTLLPLLSQMPERQAELRDILAQMDAETLVPNTPDVAAKTNIPAQIESKDGSSTQQRPNDVIEVQVAIEPALREQVSPQTLVFVIARAIDGPRAPLAVKRYTVGSLPETIVLSDSDSMLADLQLSKFDNVEISARVSLSGQPIASAGDFAAEPIRFDRENPNLIKLLINQVIE